jgi:transglutaminase-like putative cysteine protease
VTLPKAPSRIPLPALGAAVVALTAFGLVAGFKPLLIGFLLLIGGSYFSSFRLGDSTIRWWVRIGLLLLAVSLHIGDPQQQDSTIGATRGRNVLAMAAAAEVVYQFWRFRARDPLWGPLATLFFSGCVLTAATNTTYESGLPYLAPLFFVLCLWAILTLRPRKSGGGIGARRGAVLIGTLALAALATGYIGRKRNEIMDVGLSFMTGRWAEFQEMGQGENPELGPLFESRGTPARILKVEGYDGGHLRGATFYDYLNGAWRPALSARHYSPAGSNTLAVPPPRGHVPKDVRVTRLATGYPLVYFPLATVSLDLGDAESPEYARDEDGPVRASERPPYSYQFRFVDGLKGETFQGPLATKPKPDLRERCLNLPPEIAPKIRSLAQAAAKGAKTDPEKIATVIATLQAEHKYSLSYRPSGRRGDPVVDFLDNKKDAHCEFFASSAALLLRGLDVPTRYVTGFYAHEQEAGGELVVRQRDAHAWVEAYVKNIGWVTVEATPPSGLPDEKQESVESWRRFYEKLQDAFLRFKDWLSELPADQLTLISVAFLVALASVGAARWWRDRKRERSLTPSGLALPPLALRDLAARFEKLLSKSGASVAPARPWSESVASLPTDAIRARAEAFVALYDQVRFGGQEAERRALDESLTALERALAEEKSKKSG